MSQNEPAITSVSRCLRSYKHLARCMYLKIFLVLVVVLKVLVVKNSCFCIILLNTSQLFHVHSQRKSVLTLEKKLAMLNL